MENINMALTMVGSDTGLTRDEIAPLLDKLDNADEVFPVVIEGDNGYAVGFIENDAYTDYADAKGRETIEDSVRYVLNDWDNQNESNEYEVTLPDTNSLGYAFENKSIRYFLGNIVYEATEALPKEFYENVINLLSTRDSMSEDEPPINIADVKFPNGTEFEINVYGDKDMTPYTHAQLWEPTSAYGLDFDVAEPEDDLILGDWEAEGRDTYVIHVVLEA